MKVEIDTTQKVLTIIDECTVQELINFINENGLSEYSLRQKVETVPVYPYHPIITIEPPYYVTNDVKDFCIDWCSIQTSRLN